MKKTRYVIILLNLIIVVRLFYICIYNHNYYKNINNNLMSRFVTLNNAPRGRILDINGNVLVDNKGIKSLVYSKNSNDNIFDVVEFLNNNIKINNINISDIDIYNYLYNKNKKEIDKKLDKNIIEKYKSKLISEKEFMEYKYSYIDINDIDNVSKEEVYFYKLITDGYSFQDKVVKNNISDEEFLIINNSNISSLHVDIKWVRTYNYDTCLNQIFGTIGNIESEKLDVYLNKGYKLNDIVGNNFLEYKYDEYLRGKDALYLLNEDNSLKKISDEEKGNDLVLNIDINIQLKIEEVLKKEILNVKKYPSSKYYHGTHVIVSNPNNGAIIAMASFKDTLDSNVVSLFTDSITPGSIVKGASQSVAFINGVIDDKKVLDSCIKLKNMPAKCSWARLGYLSDIDALAKSSNYYQFLNAIKVSNKKYTYNMYFNPSEEDFNKYRNVFASYGLGSSTGIDLYEEKLGITGKRISGDLLLNYVIGQYDTYTPLMITSYINTLANDGVRMKLRIADHIIGKNNINININDVEVIDSVDIKLEYLKRVQEGFKHVLINGTGVGYINSKYKPAGKTGTSETFVGNIPTTTKSFIGYMPYDNPIYSLTIISPNLGYKNSISNYKYPINSKLSNQISNILFEK